VIGGLALIALVVALIFILNNDEETTKTTTTSTPAPKKETPKEEPPPPPPTDITNLLPNSTEAVVKAEGGGLLIGPLGSAAVDTPGAFRKDVIEERLGFKLDDIDRIVIGINFSEDWAFGVVRTARAISKDNLKEKMRLTAAPEKIQEMEYFITDPIHWFDDIQ